MASFYEDVPIQWQEGDQTLGRGLGNHVAWMCKCNHLMLAPHEELYLVPACPTCGRKFRVLRKAKNLAMCDAWWSGWKSPSPAGEKNQTAKALNPKIASPRRQAQCRSNPAASRNRGKGKCLTPAISKSLRQTRWQTIKKRSREKADFPEQPTRACPGSSPLFSQRHSECGHSGNAALGNRRGWQRSDACDSVRCR